MQVRINATLQKQNPTLYFWSQLFYCHYFHTDETWLRKVYSVGWLSAVEAQGYRQWTMEECPLSE